MRTRRRLTFAIVVAWAGTALGVACGLDVEPGAAPIVEDEAGRPEASLPPPADADKTPTDGGPDSGDAAANCEGLPGPTMVQSPDKSFCIDSTEVTNAQYDEFLAATAGGTDAGFLDAAVFDGGAAPTFCFPFQSFAPKPNPLGTPSEPVTRVTWCDAFAYCQWAQKHLCTGDTDAGPGEWSRACTDDGKRELPYGDDADASCNVGGTAQEPVGARPSCNGGYDGVFDMVGNVEEWVSRGTPPECVARSSFWGAPADASCSRARPTTPRTPVTGVGFRCCR